MNTLKQRAFNLLAIRDHGCAELHSKLVRKGFDVDEVADICQQLIESGLLDDLHFSCQYIRARSVKGYGSLRIQSELLKKSITKDVISQALLVCNLDWHALLEKVWQKKFAMMPQDIKEYVKQQRFLMQRGFDIENINALLVMKKFESHGEIF